MIILSRHFLAAAVLAILLDPETSLHALETSSFYQEQALVHRVAPSGESEELPVIMVPGHNLSSAIYLEAPDGRDGWARIFASAGHEVFVINDPKFDFSHGFPIAGFTEVPTEGAPPANPNATQAWGQDIWRRWGFGPSEGTPYPDAKFPTDAFETFKEAYPWLSSGATTSYAAAIASLLEANGPAILVAHSAGGPQAVDAASVHPGLVAAIVLIEPTGPPTEADFPTLAGLSMLGVYGDYIESRSQTNRKNATIAAAALFEANGGTGTIIDLPEQYGVSGNSHLLMQDSNNDMIAALVLDWLEEHATIVDKPRRPRGSGKGGRKGGGRRGGGMPEAILTELDADGNGSLDESEFGRGRRFQGADRSQVREAFRAADGDGDGSVTSEELEQSFQSLRGGA